MLQTGLNCLLIKVKRKYAENAQSKIFKMSEIQNMSTVSAADCVTIIGEVVSLPVAITDNKFYEGFSTKDIKVGDTAIFRYDVIFDFLQQVQEDNDEPNFKNRLFYKGEEYFLADIVKIFGVIRGEEIIMVNGYTMVDEFEVSNIVLPQHMKKTKQTSLTKVLYIGNPKTHLPKLPIQPMDEVYFNPFTAQHYEIKGKKFCILPQEKILGKVQK